MRYIHTRRFAAMLVTMLCIGFLGVLFLNNQNAIRTDQDMRFYQLHAYDISEVLAGKSTSYSSDYPPLANILFYVISANPLGIPFHVAFALSMLLGFLFCLLYAEGYLHSGDARWFGIATTIVICLLAPVQFFARYDFFITILLFLCWKAFERKRYQHAAFFITLGIFLKFAPIFAVPVLLGATPKQERKKLLKGFVAGSVFAILCSVLFLGVTGTIGNVSSFIHVRANQYPHMFSALSSMEVMIRYLLGSKAHMEFIKPYLGHFNMDFAPYTGKLLLALLATCSALIGYQIRRVKHEAAFAPFFFATIVLAYLISPVVTPQYYFWVLPLILCWAFEGADKERSFSFPVISVISLVLAVCVTMTMVYPSHYSDLVSQTKFFALFFNLLRNILVGALCWYLLAMHAYPETPHTSKGLSV